MSGPEAKGMWIDGKANKKEMAFLQNLIKTACAKFTRGELPWHFQNEKITFDAKASGKTLNVFYGWNFPPPKFWKKTANPNECVNCDPESKHPKREVWCEKSNYHFNVCPYGAPTPKGIKN